MINKIGVKNFRGFKDNTEFELAPITILTGPNNSGKSSFLKLIELLKVSFGSHYNFHKLRFDSGNHNLGTFNKVLNWENSSDKITLTFDFPLDYFDEDFKLELIYSPEKENGTLTSFKIFNKHRTLILMDYKYEYFDGVLDITYLKRIFNQYTICKDENNYSKNIIKVFKKYNDNLPLKNPTDEEIDFHNRISTIASNLSIISEEPTTLKPQKEPIKIDDFAKIFFNEDYLELANINESIPISCITFRKELYEKKLGVKLKDLGLNYDDQSVLEAENKFFSSVVFCKNILVMCDYHDWSPSINELFINEIFKLDDYYYQFNNIILGEEYEGLQDILEPKKELEALFNKYFIKSIGKALKRLHSSLNGIDFISASRGNKNRILSNKSNYDIDEIVKEFQNILWDDKKRFFLEESFNILEIKGDIKIERFEGVASVLYLEINEKKISLADLGYGYSQIIPIILKILLITNETESYYWNEHRLTDSEMSDFFSIIIEEPEANLHPNLQSKLADVLVLAYQRFGIHFILETHSEYLIRKLQFLTAKGEIKEGDVNIYYYNDDRYVSKEEPKVKEIKIDEYGGLTDSFGPGFFDEATKLQFELLKLNKGQSN